MIDNPGARAAVGNIYEFVLIASERVREINRQRFTDDTYTLGFEEYKKLKKPHLQALDDIVSGKVGREYLKRVRDRSRGNKQKMR